MKVAYDFLCIDEIGTPNLSEFYGKTREEVKNSSLRPHFGLAGVIIPGAIYPQINIEGRKLQEKYFGKGNFAPFHYSEILHNSKAFSFLGKDKNLKRSIVDRLNNLIDKNNFRIISNFIDKKQTALIYGYYKEKKLSIIGRIRPGISKPAVPRDTNLYDISLKFILPEFYHYLNERKKRGLIISEGRGKKEDTSLLDSFYKYQMTGVGAISGKELRNHISDLLVVQKSQNHIGLQLADLICFPLYDYFVPGHPTRPDHFIKKEIIEKKIISLSTFPTKEKPKTKTVHIIRRKRKSAKKKK